MNKLQELHKEVILAGAGTINSEDASQKRFGVDEKTYVFTEFGIDKIVLIGCTEITKNIAIEFNNWFSDNVYEDNRYDLWYLNEKYTTEELFNLFIEEKYGKD